MVLKKWRIIFFIKENMRRVVKNFKLKKQKERELESLKTKKPQIKETFDPMIFFREENILD